MTSARPIEFRRSRGAYRREIEPLDFGDASQHFRLGDECLVQASRAVVRPGITEAEIPAVAERLRNLAA